VAVESQPVGAKPHNPADLPVDSAWEKRAAANASQLAHGLLLDTEYALRPVKGGTELRVRMSYRVSTPFNWYARPIAEILVGNFEDAALRFYGHRAEGG
jgi:hypothetical protein